MTFDKIASGCFENSIPASGQVPGTLSQRDIRFKSEVFDGSVKIAATGPNGKGGLV